MTDGKWRKKRQAAAAFAFRRVAILGLVGWMACGWGGVLAEPPASSPEALDAYTSAANLQNNGAFDLAAEEWQSFLKKYANDPLAPKARHYLAVCRIQLKQFDQAEKLLTQVAKDPKFELLEDALLHLGYSRFLLGKAGDQTKLRAAADTFRQQLKRFPKGKLADQALYFQGEAWYELRELAKAAASYRALIDHFPNSSLRCDAWYALGTALEELKKWPEATAAYDAFLKECGDDPDADAVRLRKAETLVPQKKYAEALKIFDALAHQEGFADAEAAAMGAASCLFYLGDFEKAGQQYLALAEARPDSPRAAEARLAAGKAFYRAGKHDGAAEVLTPLVKTGGPERWEAAHWLARIHLAKGAPAEALKLLEQLGAESPPERWAVSLKLDRADALFDAGKLEEAYTLYASIADEAPQHPSAPQARYNAAVTALQLSRPAEARQQAEAYLKAYPQSELAADARFVLAESRLMAGDADGAAAEYEKLLKEHPDHPNASRFVLRRAAAWYVQKQYDQVIESLTRLLPSLKPSADVAQARFLLGVSYFGKKDYARAAEHLQASVLADANWAQADEALLFLARAQEANGQAERAAATLESLIKNYPKSRWLAQAHYRLGELYYKQNAYAQAQAAYDLSLQLDPDGKLAPFARSGKAWALMRQQKYADAEKELSALIEQAPDTSAGREARLARAICRRHLKQYSGALEDLDALEQLEVAPSLKADALYEKGLTLVDAKRAADAVNVFRKLLEEHPDYPKRDRVWFELAWALKSSDAQGSLKSFERLVKDHPKSDLVGEAWFQIGEGHYAEKKWSDAETAYRRALELAKDAQVAELATYKLGWSLYQQGKYAEAAEQFANQVSQYGQGKLYADGLFMLGECRFKRKDYEGAWESFQKARQFPARTPQIAALLLVHGAQSAEQLGQWQEAKAWLTDFLKEYPKSLLVPEARYELGRALHKLGDLDGARRAWEQATAEAKSVIAVQAQFMLGELAFEQKQYDEAVKQFRKAMYRFGAEKAPAEFHSWQARAAFEAARCHEVRIGTAQSAAQRLQHLREADRFYRHVVEKYPRSDVAAAARKRLAELARLQ